MTTDGIQVVETADIEEAIRERGDRPLPPALPVLPLKEMVAYPDTLTPLAVGQERSVKLIDDVLSGERTLVLAASRDPEIEGWPTEWDWEAMLGGGDPVVLSAHQVGFLALVEEDE